jgi:hypothetical protein
MKAFSRLWAGGKVEPALGGTTNWSMVEKLCKSSVGDSVEALQKGEECVLDDRTRKFSSASSGRGSFVVICACQMCHALFGLVWQVGSVGKTCVVLLLVQPEEGCQRHGAGLAAQKSHIMHVVVHTKVELRRNIDDLDARKVSRLL